MPYKTETRIFKGSESSPLLAPRGAYISNGKLYVSDTAQNRLFIWNQIPDTEYADPDVVLGQDKQASTERNAGGQVNGSTLFYPSGIWSDGQKLILADAWNHRVLIWHTHPTENGQPADVVLGQPNVHGNLPNVEGVGKSPSAQSMNWPYGVYSDGRQLWVADTGNRRVLFYEEIPTTSFQAADAVIGKATFTERDYDHNDPIWPYSAKISPDGSMAITDTQYYRVLLWHNWKDAFSKKADVIIGQSSFNDNGQNQFQWFPGPNTLNWCYDTCFYKDGIWVADTGNSRLLWYKSIPTHHNAQADNVLGQKDFKTGSENQSTIWTTENSLYWPFQVSIENHLMVLADTGNHRIVINKLLD